MKLVCYNVCYQTWNAIILCRRSYGRLYSKQKVLITVELVKLFLTSGFFILLYKFYDFVSFSIAHMCFMFAVMYSNKIFALKSDKFKLAIEILVN